MILSWKLLKNRRELDLAITVIFSISNYCIYKLDNKIIWIVCSIFLLIYFLRKWKNLTLSLLFTTLIIISDYLFSINIKESHVDGMYEVCDVVGDKPVIKIDSTKVILNTFKYKDQFYKGDIIFVKGDAKIPYNFSDFDYVSYLKTHKIKLIVSYPQISFESHSQTLHTQIMNYFQKYQNHFSKFGPLLLLGKKTIENNDIYQTSLSLNIVHLFVVSGFHLTLLYSLINYVLNKINKKFLLANQLFGLIIICFYCYLLEFSISSLRALLIIIFSLVNKKFFNNKYNKISTLAIMALIFLIYNPYNIYSLSFIFTFLATFAIFLSNKIKFKNKLFNYLKAPLFAYSMNILISIYINQIWSIFGLLFGIALTPLFVIMYILNILLIWCPFILNYIYQGFEYILICYKTINISIYINFLDIKIIQTVYSLLIGYLVISPKWNRSITDNI